MKSFTKMNYNQLEQLSLTQANKIANLEDRLDILSKEYVNKEDELKYEQKQRDNLTQKNK